MYVYLCLCVSMHVFVHVHVRVDMCVHVCVHVRKYVRMYASMHVCVCSCMYVVCVKLSVTLHQNINHMRTGILKKDPISVSWILLRAPNRHVLGIQ